MPAERGTTWENSAARPANEGWRCWAAGAARRRRRRNGARLEVPFGRFFLRVVALQSSGRSEGRGSFRVLYLLCSRCISSLLQGLSENKVT